MQLTCPAEGQGGNVARQPMRIGKEQLRSVGARTEPADGIQRGLDEVCARLCERVGVQQLSQRLQQRRRPSDTAGVPVGNPACRLLR